MDYTVQVDKALLFIEEHLRDDISLEDIADVVNMSMYHFHRIFTSSTEYSLKDYIRKRRLSCACRDLVFNKDRIKEIALRYQFQSQEAFIRAIKKEFSKTPGQIRNDQSVICAVQALNLADIKNILKQRKEDVIMETKMMNLDELKLIGLRCTSTQKENTIPQLWDNYMKIYNDIPNKIDSPCFGVCIHMDMEECTENTPFDYIAGTCVSSLDNIPEGMIGYIIPKGKFVAFTHKGSLDTLDKTYSYIYGVWANETDCDLDQRDQIELYDERFKYGEADSEMDILVPIK